MSPRSRLTASGRGRQSGSGSVTVTCCVESVSVKHGETGKKKQMNKKRLGFGWFFVALFHEWVPEKIIWEDTS